MNPDYRLTFEALTYPLPGHFEIRQMAREFRRAVGETVPKGVAVPMYDIQQLLY